MRIDTSLVWGDPASHSAMNVSAPSSATSHRPRTWSLQSEVRSDEARAFGIAEALCEPQRFLRREPRRAARLPRATPRRQGCSRWSRQRASRSRARARGRVPCPRPRRGRRGSSSPSRWSSACARGARRAGVPRAISNAASATRFPSSHCPAIARVRAETASTRAPEGETESPASFSARERCARVASPCPRYHETSARNASVSAASSVSPTASSASRASSSACSLRSSVAISTARVPGGTEGPLVRRRARARARGLPRNVLRPRRRSC